MKAIYIQHLAEPLSHKSGLCLYYQAILVRLVFNRWTPTSHLQIPTLVAVSRLRMYRSFLTVQLNFHSLVPCRLISWTLYIFYEQWGLVLRLPGNHSAYTCLTPLNSPQQVLRPSRSPILCRPGCTLQDTPRLRPPLVLCPKTRVCDFIVHL